MKHQTLEQPTAHRRNHKGNQKLLRDKWKWKQNILKLMGLSESGAKEDLTINVLMEKQESSQINNLTLNLRNQKKN